MADFLAKKLKVQKLRLLNRQIALKEPRHLSLKKPQHLSLKVTEKQALACPKNQGEYIIAMPADPTSKSDTTESLQTTSPKGETREEPTTISFVEFLESVPPQVTREITFLGRYLELARGGGVKLFAPAIKLHCPSEQCNGIRVFRRDGEEEGLPFIGESMSYFYLHYVCSNCRLTRKVFSLGVSAKVTGSTAGQCFKFGEFPPYGPPTPARFIKLVGPDRELFLKGRQSENQGLGVGAFSYYRRVVENQKNRILDEIIKVSEKIGASPEVIKILKDAIDETQFSKALTSVKDAIPQTLFINGQNPLTLLHGALSDGLHVKTDEQCLNIARDVRVVLVKLSELLSQALKDEQELTSAVTRLIRVKQGQ